MVKLFTYFLLSAALLLNSALPAFTQASQIQGADIKALEELYGKKGKVLICTNYGFKYVSIEDIQKNQEDNSSEGHCPLCIIKAVDNNIAPSKSNSIELKYSDYISFYTSEISVKISFDNYYSYKTTLSPPKFS